MNIDDMADIYSMNRGVSVLNKDMYGLVPEEKVNGTIDRSYNAHKEANESSSKKFKGVEWRYTNGLTNGGHIAPIWLQIPGRSAEMSPEKSTSGVVIGVEGLTVVSITKV